MAATNNIFCCPVCKAEFSEDKNSLVCENGHRFDISASGYVNLLPVQKKNSKVPGDSKEMVMSRRNFLSKGSYEPLKEAVKKEISKIGKGFVFDCGCGEGYYTDGIAEVSAKTFGIDISKIAVEKAAKKYKNAFFAVASAYDLPVKSESVDIVCDIFAPLSTEEFKRILVPGGFFLYVVPAEKHLMKMKEILYNKPYENAFSRAEYDGFTYIKNEKISFPIEVCGKEDVMSLFTMTPYSWRTPKEGIDRLAKTEKLCDTAEFYIHILKKNTER